MSPTSTVTLRMIYFTTWEVMFTPGDSDVYMTINQLSGLSDITAWNCHQSDLSARQRFMYLGTCQLILQHIVLWPFDKKLASDWSWENDTSQRTWSGHEVGLSMLYY